MFQWTAKTFPTVKAFPSSERNNLSEYPGLALRSPSGADPGQMPTPLANEILLQVCLQGKPGVPVLGGGTWIPDMLFFKGKHYIWPLTEDQFTSGNPTRGKLPQKKWGIQSPIIIVSVICDDIFSVWNDHFMEWPIILLKWQTEQWGTQAHNTTNHTNKVICIKPQLTVRAGQSWTYCTQF